MNFDFLSQFNFKKVLLIILFLALCVGLGFGIYWLFFRSAPPQPGEPGYMTSGGGLPGAGENTGGQLAGQGGELPQAGETPNTTLEPEEIASVAQGGKTVALPLESDKVKGVVLASDGQGVNFYNTQDNKFYTLSADGRKMLPLSNQEFYEVEDVAWSADKSKIVISYPDGSKVLYDFNKDKPTTLSKEVTEPVFSSQDKVAYKYVAENSADNWLAVTDLLGGQVNLIESLGDNADAVQVAWSPNSQVVALYGKPVGLNKSEVFFIGLNNENFKSLVVEGTDFKGLWSPDGSKLLYHAVISDNNFNPNLWVVDVDEDNIGRHKFNLGLSTWIDKCVFADALTVYCAVPRELPQGAGLYPEIVGATDDLIYKINLANGYKEIIADPIFSNESTNQENKFSISALQVSKDGRMLFFWDSLTQQIYKVYLK